MNTDIRPWIIVLGIGLAGCAMDERLPTELGGACGLDTQCASGQCGHLDGRSFCTEECVDASGCSAEAGLPLCRPEGFCAPACREGERSGTGATALLCRGGAFVACSDQDPATACAACGCEPFGGGMCTSTGCELPRADGEACTTDLQCASRACYRDTNVCGAPRPMGEPCTVDAECATSNCSADGAAGVTGVCNQALGTTCTRSTTTCTRCIGASTLSDGICSRRRCDPERAPTCPRVSRRTWTCDRTVDGDHRCFETCDYEASYWCLEDSDYCHMDGYCY